MVTHGAPSIRIRALAVAGTFALAMFTFAATSSTATAAAAAAPLMNSAPMASAPMASAPMDAKHDVPGMEMDKPADAHEHGGTASTPHKVPGMEMDKPAGARENGDDAHEHGDIPAPAPTPAPTSGDMPGMDMPADSSEHGDASEHGDTGGHGDAGGHGTATEPTTERPLVPVLGTFGGGTAAVMLTAGLMRRKDRERLQLRQAARAARRSAK